MSNKLDELAEQYFSDYMLKDVQTLGDLFQLIKRILQEQDKRTRHACAETAESEVAEYLHGNFSTLTDEYVRWIASAAGRACMNVDTFKDGE